mmetsp:Transcript_65034/g.170313  ORF Transcript_65034/g.170313 Transcript_65034/m.170313 type:complete len:378 (+) Transcript_65034:471-1604(+)
MRPTFSGDLVAPEEPPNRAFRGESRLLLEVAPLPIGVVVAPSIWRQGQGELAQHELRLGRLRHQRLVQVARLAMLPHPAGVRRIPEALVVVVVQPHGALHVAQPPGPPPSLPASVNHHRGAPVEVRPDQRRGVYVELRHLVPVLLLWRDPTTSPAREQTPDLRPEAGRCLADLVAQAQAEEALALAPALGPSEQHSEVHAPVRGAKPPRVLHALPAVVLTVLRARGAVEVQQHLEPELLRPPHREVHVLQRRALEGFPGGRAQHHPAAQGQPDGVQAARLDLHKVMPRDVSLPVRCQVADGPFLPQDPHEAPLTFRLLGRAAGVAREERVGGAGLQQQPAAQIHASPRLAPGSLHGARRASPLGSRARASSGRRKNK